MLPAKVYHCSNFRFLDYFSDNRTWSTVHPRGGISPPVRSCFSQGVVPSSAFLLSIRPSTSHSAPPCTPMPSGFLREESVDSRPTTRGASWCEPFTGWERSAASLGSLDSAAPLPSTAVTSIDNKRRQNHPVFNFSSEVYENTKGMTLSDDSLHAKQQHNTTRQEPRHQLKAKTLPAAGLSRDKKGRVHSQELLSINSSVSPHLRKSLTRPVACLLVLGGKTRTQADMGRSLDIWRCDIDPGMVLL